MKMISRAINPWFRRARRVASDARYLNLLAEQLAASSNYEQQVSIYGDYRAAHRQLARLVGLHGMNEALVPALIRPPVARGQEV